MSSWVVTEQAWRKGPWTPEEDKLLIEYVNQHGEGRWSCVSKLSACLKRSGNSCRLRWVNYLRPGLKKGNITQQEEGIIIELHALWGNKWSTIARYLPGRTDNEIKNYWRTHFKKRSKPSSSLKSNQAETIKYTMHHQKLQKANHENGIENINEEFSSHHAPYDDEQYISKHENKAGLMYPIKGNDNNNNNNNQLLSTVFHPDYNIHSGYNNWADFLMVDNNLWGGLWNQE